MPETQQCDQNVELPGTTVYSTYMSTKQLREKNESKSVECTVVTLNDSRYPHNASMGALFPVVTLG